MRSVIIPELSRSRRPWPPRRMASPRSAAPRQPRRSTLMPRSPSVRQSPRTRTRWLRAGSSSRPAPSARRQVRWRTGSPCRSSSRSASASASNSAWRPDGSARPRAEALRPESPSSGRGEMALDGRRSRDRRVRDPAGLVLADRFGRLRPGIGEGRVERAVDLEPPDRAGLARCQCGLHEAWRREHRGPARQHRVGAAAALPIAGRVGWAAEVYGYPVQADRTTPPGCGAAPAGPGRPTCWTPAPSSTSRASAYVDVVGLTWNIGGIWLSSAPARP